MIPFWKAKAFWHIVSIIGAGILAGLVFFEVLPPKFLIAAPALYAVVETVFKFFEIELELRMRGLLKK